MSSRDLHDLHPQLQPLATAFIQKCEAAGITILITTTYRSNSEQDQLYELGRTVRSHVGPWTVKRRLGSIVTRARGGQSEHNYMLGGAPASLAFDFVPLVAGKPVWDDRSPLWQQAGKIGIDLGLNWYGAPTAPFKESPHMAHRDSRSLMAGAVA
jgi:peptidoglycan L-alanyl-D-glutamate endopeptidase CwlK